MMPRSLTIHHFSIIMSSARQLALLALQEIEHKGAYTDIALDRVLRSANLEARDRGLTTELVYGIVRQRRSLDALIDCLGKKKAAQQPPLLRSILHLGLYQLRYLTQVPPSAAVNTSVDLAKNNGLGKLSGVVNGLLRQYTRLANNNVDPLPLPADPVQRLGTLYSFPDWIVKIWIEYFGMAETEQLCAWFNQPPHLDLRVNPLKTSLEAVEAAFKQAQIPLTRVESIDKALRLERGSGAIQKLPGFQEGWWTIQDASAQLVTHLLDPQPGETILDACAAPGGKTTHIAELMGDRGTILARDRDEKRLRKVRDNAQRLGLTCIQTQVSDSRDRAPQPLCDRVLVDAPCSGLGTLHRHPDIRWRQSGDRIDALIQLQEELLASAATWVKPGGILVYATCTLNPAENEAVVQSFLQRQSHWQIIPSILHPVAMGVTPEGWMRVLPHRYDMDGFFMVKLQHQ
jgi:16S rRNA (cytosine967-C5)-methyltransferase